MGFDRERDLSYVNPLCDESDRFMLSDVTARPFERLQFLRGTRNYSLTLPMAQQKCGRWLKWHMNSILKIFVPGVNPMLMPIFFMDDWGTNHSLLINPKTWRELFKPLHKEYCDLIKVGIDDINSQLFCMNIEARRVNIKDKVTFWGGIDRHYAIPFGDSNAVCEAVMRVRRAFDEDSGGVIAQCAWGKDNSQENVRTVFETWLKSVN